MSPTRAWPTGCRHCDLFDPMRSHLHAAFFLGVLSGSAASAAWAAECADDQKPFAALQADERYTIEGPFTVAALEARHMIRIRETGEVVAFGPSHERWNTLKARMLGGDQIFSLAFRVGRSQVDGYALIHAGCVVQFLIRNMD